MKEQNTNLNAKASEFITSFKNTKNKTWTITFIVLNSFLLAAFLVAFLLACFGETFSSLTQRIAAALIWLALILIDAYFLARLISLLIILYASEDSSINSLNRNLKIYLVLSCRYQALKEIKETN
ncbi:hypothetical protein ACNQ1X_01470 [Mycoplasma sp. SK341A]|uniref:hypothetical protein n=1 Tax=unclassified Mycoplasma TaxID=2683645 RepID=UPI003AAD52E4